MRTGGAVGLDAHALVGNFAGERLGVGGGARTGSGKADIHGFDAEGLHQMENLYFIGDRRIGDRGILQSVAQRFVIKQNASSRRNRWRSRGVPVVDPIGVITGIKHGKHILARSGHMFSVASEASLRAGKILPVVLPPWSSLGRERWGRIWNDLSRQIVARRRRRSASLFPHRAAFRRSCGPCNAGTTARE